MALQESLDGLSIAIDELIATGNKLKRDNAALLEALRLINSLPGRTGGAKSLVNEFRSIARAAIRQAEGD